jgi:prolyl oligopeptidase
MKMTQWILACLNLFGNGAAIAQLTYPVTAKGTISDNYFGMNVSDPYRWLEHDNSVETKGLVTAQNSLTRSYLEAIPFRDSVKQRLSQL